MEKWKIKKGDFVQVVTGKNSGQKGEIISVDRERRKVFVRGVNIVSVFKKPTAGDPGGVFKKEAGIHVSNVAFIDPEFGRPTKIGFKTGEDGKKVRYAKLSGNVIK